MAPTIGDEKNPSPGGRRVGVPERFERRVQQVPFDRRHQQGVKKHRPGVVAVHAVLAVQRPPCEGTGRAEPARDAGDVQLEKLEVVGADRQVASRDGGEHGGGRPGAQPLPLKDDRVDGDDHRARGTPE